MYIKLKADGYQAEVDTQSVVSHCSDNSYLLQTMNLVLSNPDPTVRLNCSEAVAAEVVAALRLGSHYNAPEDPRLLNAVRHQLDFLGVFCTWHASGVLSREARSPVGSYVHWSSSSGRG